MCFPVDNFSFKAVDYPIGQVAQRWRNGGATVAQWWGHFKL